MSDIDMVLSVHLHYIVQPYSQLCKGHSYYWMYMEKKTQLVCDKSKTFFFDSYSNVDMQF